MMRIKSVVLFIFVLVLLVSFGHAHEKFQGGVNFSLGFPQSEFKDNVDQIGLGGFGHFAYNFRNSPLALGLSLGFLVYGSETREEPLSIAIPEVYVDVTTTNNIFLCHFLVRIQPPVGKFRPYLDGLIGFNNFYTNTRVHSQRSSEDDTIARTNIHNDLAFSYGAGGGLMIEVYSSQKSGEGGPVVLSVDMAIKYLKGGKAEYLKEGSIFLDNDKALYTAECSITDLVTGYVGVSFSF